MADIVYLLVIIGFFALAALFVRACAAIIGPIEPAVPDQIEESAPETLAA